MDSLIAFSCLAHGYNVADHDMIQEIRRNVSL